LLTAAHAQLMLFVPDHAGKLTALLGPLEDGKRACCHIYKNPTLAFS